MSHQNNITRIKIVYDALGDLADTVVFVGGSTVSLYADRQAFEIRETDDVDVIVGIITYPELGAFEKEIRKRGFSNDTSAKFLARYKIKGVTVDFMPITGILGFKNDWYLEGYRNSINHRINDTFTIKILAPEYFLATKIEAFKARGSNDPRQSQDFEDIVFILENRRAIWQEIAGSDVTLRNYLKQEFGNILSNSSVYEWIDCHIEFDSPPSTDLIIAELKRFIA